MSNWIQLTTDGHRVYAVESAFGANIYYAKLIKVYGADREQSEARYSPAGYMGCHTIFFKLTDPLPDDRTMTLQRAAMLTPRHFGDIPRVG